MQAPWILARKIWLEKSKKYGFFKKHLIETHMNYETIPSRETIDKTKKSLEERNISVTVVESGADAFEFIKNMIPKGASVMNGSSTTLKQIGFVDYLSSDGHGWNNLHTAILVEQDKNKQARMRAESVLADYFLGSVHAITEEGTVMIASATGSQLPSYAFSSPNVIWVVSTNKIVPTLEDGFRRIKEYVFPLEDKRMKEVGYPGSAIGKILLFEREIMERKIHLILVNEKLGF